MPGMAPQTPYRFPADQPDPRPDRPAHTETFDHLDELHRRQDVVNRTHVVSTDAWRQARRDVLVGYVLEELGLDRLDLLLPEERTVVQWLASWDADTVAGIVQLMRLARLRDAQ
jgi:hypothetical protein